MTGKTQGAERVIVLHSEPRFSRVKNILPKEDQAQLRMIRESRKAGPLQSQINNANLIHTPSLRDAALGHVLKHWIRYVIDTPALQKDIPYQQTDLRFFAQMVSDPAKRERMLRRIDGMAKTNTDRKD